MIPGTQTQSNHTACVYIRTLWQNAQAALNHNTFHWSRLNSHETFFEEGNWTDKKPFFNEKTLLRGSIKKDRAGRCIRDRCSPVFVTSVPAACMHHNIQHIIIYDIYKSPVITVSHFPSLSLSLCHCLTHFLSFGHNSKYPIGPGCRLLVLVYLVLGSIRLQAEASHSSQCHKMWLVLTTALRGDGLIGLIASDRLGWTSYRKTAARCGSLLAILYVLLSFFPSIVTLHLLFPHYRFASLFASFYLINSVFISSCLQTVCFFTLSHFFYTWQVLLCCAQITLQQSNLNANIVSFSFFLFCNVIFKWYNKPSSP